MSKTGLSGTVGGVHQAPPPERAVDEINDSATTEEQRHSSDITTTDNHQIPRAICWRLYVSHFLSTWNSRSFEFGSVLFLAHLYPDTLRYLSIYALIRSASAIITSTPLGRAIDHYARLPVVRLSIVFGRVPVIVSVVGFWGMERLSGRAKLGIYIGLVALACVEKSAAVVNLVAIERDWLVTIAEAHEAALSKMNARMRRIDLICKLVGPLFTALIDGGSTTAALWVTAGLNIVSFPIEYFAIAQVHSVVPKLQAPKRVQELGVTIFPTEHSTLTRKITTSINNVFASWHHYFVHQAFLPSFSLALLYLTVLSFAGQMVTYLASAGFTSFTIGLVRSLSVIFELSATWLAPRLQQRISPYRAGMWFLSWQTLWLAATAGFFWSEPTPVVAASGLAAGTILSRIGLWGYDLSASVIVQTEVRGERRGTFSSTEQLFQNAFELVSFALTIALPRPDQFKYPVLVSAIAVALAGTLYARFLRQKRGHLVHTCAGKM